MKETPTGKLHRLLEEKGFTICSWHPTQGFWRKEDCVRWEARATHKDYTGLVNLFSWDTITACARNGITLRPDILPDGSKCYGHLEVAANRRETAAAKQKRVNH